MSKISKSPDRHTFQKEGYVNRCKENGQEPNQDYLEFFERMINEHDSKFDDSESRKNNLEYDLRTSELIREKCKNISYAQNLYAALCNTEWQKMEVFPILKDETWSCSWRYAGGIIADIREEGDYIDWYCSGIAGGDEPDVYKDGHDLKRKGYLPEGEVNPIIEQDLRDLGWQLAKTYEKG